MLTSRKCQLRNREPRDQTTFHQESNTNVPAHSPRRFNDQFNSIQCSTLETWIFLLLFCFSSGGGAPFHKTEIRSLDTTLQQFHLGWLPALGATESHLEHPTDVKSSWRKLGLALQVRLLAAGYLAEIISRCGESLGRDSHYRSIHYFREASRCCLVVEKRW